MNINGWKIQWLQIFEKRFTELVLKVNDLSKKDPEGYQSHPATKLLASIQETIDDIAKDPFHKKFRMGKTLGGKYTHWRRAKRLLPNRYRLFFRVHSPDQVIIIAWLNDGTTLRKKGDKKDVYEVFKHMLKVGDIANDIQELKKQAQKPPM